MLEKQDIEVSVIIVNYNTLTLTKNCLDSIKKFTKDIHYEVILVDNGSTDGSKEFFANYPSINFIYSDTNLGFGKANNLGYANSKGKYIFLLNSDTILLNNAIKIFKDEMDLMPADVACIGTRLLSEKLEYNHSFNLLPSMKGILKSIAETYLRIFNIRFKSFNERAFDDLKSFDVEYIIGADLFIRKNVVENYGLFDSDFFMYFEDSYLQYYYGLQNLTMKIITGPKIIHLENKSSETTVKHYSFIREKMYHEGLFIYMRKRYGLLIYLFFRLLFILRLPLFLRSRFKFKEKLALIALTLDFTK
ncbi:glycosyltransferase family 2 protein [Maribacter sp. MAR_2009_72]|uniref:glycosyltransferase family 2 protein n=1 Tax=Maribacter sp. MAR_2009_72 TaxID=1250050 RepID=UPI00119C0FE1|nr:glycosyltransferase [Maribacter sp. MAR_2009_72]TVZ16941.1 hypothetical protein JM81_3213 [Maribacter sp. MAR_2009_72]